MNPTELQQPILEGGIRSINFFNGRLLTARDLTREQAANREVDRRLGRAVGEGIAYGLEVLKAPQATNASPVLTVEPGLAINRRGQTLQLASRIDIALVRKASDSVNASQVFSECLPLQTGTYVAGAGVYLLAVTPAETSEGLAATAGLENGTASCNRDALVSAVQFRLIQLNPPLTATELQDENHLRNLIAYKCFGVADRESFVSDPFGPAVEQYGLLDGLRPNRLTDCDVPLAVLYWTLSDGLKFIDLWSVRRRIIHPSTDKHWPLLTSDRQTGEGEAMFLQFQAQIQEQIDSGLPLSTVTARGRFGHLPPAGILRVGSPHGFDYASFFNGMTYRAPIFIEGAQLRPLFQEAFNYPPIDTSSNVVVWLYIVRENAQAALSTSNPPQTYLIFASGHTLYRGEARYDVHHWNFGNFS